MRAIAETPFRCSVLGRDGEPPVVYAFSMLAYPGVVFALHPSAIWGSAGDWATRPEDGWKVSEWTTGLAVSVGYAPTEAQAQADALEQANAIVSHHAKTAAELQAHIKAQGNVINVAFEILMRGGGHRWASSG